LADNVRLIDGGDGRDVLSFGSPEDVFTGDINGIVVDLNEGTARAVYEDGAGEGRIFAFEVRNVEVLLGTNAADYFVADGDTMESQVLRGKAGDDYLVGGAGDDVLEGGAGSDYLIGGAGADTFLVSATSEIDVIDDLDIAAGDRVVFRDPSFDVGSVQLVRVADLLASTEVDGQRLASLALSDQDWVVRSPTHSSLAILLSGTSTLASSAVMASVVSSAGSGIDYDAADPKINDMVPSIWEGAGSIWDQREIEVPLVDLAAASERPSAASNTLLDSFFGETNNFDDISQTLGVIADAKFEKAYAAQANEMTLINSSIDGGSFVGFSGSAGDDVLIADGQDSVLIGGSGGSDRLIGDSGDDILIAAVQSTRDESDTVSMQGGGGADLFVFANIAPDEVTDGLNAIYKVRIEDFNRDEGDRVVLAGYGDGAQVGNIAQIGEVTTTEDGRYEQAVTVFSDLTSPDDTGLSVVFDISFMRQFDSEFQLRLADFDAL
jgi:Ca2+-binding RTX toxin-like protein